MKYFNTLPLIAQKDQTNNYILTSNLLTRAYFLPSLVTDISTMYSYDVIDSDTPENIAYKYYGNVDRFWIILYANNVYDYKAEWVLNDNEFNNYLFSKYKNDAAIYLSKSVDDITFIDINTYTRLTSHHYEQKISTKNSNDFQYQTITIEIDKTAYDNLVESEKTSYFGDGTSVTKTITKSDVKIYDYEFQENEKKRKIKLINKDNVVTIEKQFQRLMGG